MSQSIVIYLYYFGGKKIATISVPFSILLPTAKAAKLHAKMVFGVPDVMKRLCRLCRAVQMMCLQPQLSLCHYCHLLASHVTTQLGSPDTFYHLSKQHGTRHTL